MWVPGMEFRFLCFSRQVLDWLNRIHSLVVLWSVCLFVCLFAQPKSCHDWLAGQLLRLGGSLSSEKWNGEARKHRIPLLGALTDFCHLWSQEMRIQMLMQCFSQGCWGQQPSLIIYQCMDFLLFQNPAESRKHSEKDPANCTEREEIWGSLG